jgi:hypothetical protein
MLPKPSTDALVVLVGALSQLEAATGRMPVSEWRVDANGQVTPRTCPLYVLSSPV